MAEEDFSATWRETRNEAEMHCWKSQETFPDSRLGSSALKVPTRNSKQKNMKSSLMSAGSLQEKTSILLSYSFKDIDSNFKAKCLAGHCHTGFVRPLMSIRWKPITINFFFPPEMEKLAVFLSVMKQQTAALQAVCFASYLQINGLLSLQSLICLLFLSAQCQQHLARTHARTNTLLLV